MRRGNGMSGRTRVGQGHLVQHNMLKNRDGAINQGWKIMLKTGEQNETKRLVEVGVRQLHDETLLLYIDYI